MLETHFVVFSKQSLLFLITPNYKKTTTYKFQINIIVIAISITLLYLGHFAKGRKQGVRSTSHQPLIFENTTATFIDLNVFSNIFFNFFIFFVFFLKNSSLQTKQTYNTQTQKQKANNKHETNVNNYNVTKDLWIYR